MSSIDLTALTTDVRAACRSVWRQEPTDEQVQQAIDNVPVRWAILKWATDNVPQIEIPCFFGATCVDPIQVADPSYGEGTGWIVGEYPNQSLDEENWTEHLTKLRRAGCNLYRAIPYGVWGGTKKKADVLAPFRFVSEDKGWDLTHWNDNYFVVVKRMIEFATGLGFQFLFDLFDNCQGHSNSEFSPYANNISGIGSIYDSAARAINAAWVSKAVAAFGGKGVSFGQGNELKEEGVELWRRLNPLLKGKGLWTLGANSAAKQDAMLADARESLGGQADWLARPFHHCIDHETEDFQAALGFAGKSRLYLSNDGNWTTPDGIVSMIRAVRSKTTITKISLAIEWLPDWKNVDVLSGIKTIVDELRS